MAKEKNIKVNSILNIIKTLANIIFPLITFPYVNRVLLPSNVGKVNFASSYVSYFTLIATLGITTYAIRECSAVRNDKKQLEEKSSEIYSINICTTLIAYVLLLLSLLLFKKLDSYRMLIIIQSITIAFMTLGADWLNSAMEDFKYITIRTVAFQVISLVLTLIFVRNQSDYVKFAIITVISSSGANFMNIYYRRKYCTVKFTTNMSLQKHLKPILLLFVMLLAQTIFHSADVTMLGIMKNDYEVGIYSCAVKLEATISQVVSSLAWVIMPRMSLYFAEENYDKINEMLEKVLNVLMIIGLPSIAGVFAISKEIAIIVGGKEFVESSVPLMILMLSFGFSLVGGCFLGNMVLLPSKRENVYMIICCIATAVNVLLNIFLIPIGGAIAAAATTAVSSFIIMSLLLVTKDKRVKLGYVWKVMFSPFIGSVIIYLYCMLIAVFVESLWFKTAISIVGSCFLYILVLVLMKNQMCLETLTSLKNKLSRR